MKLHNYSVLYLSGALVLVLGVWASIFYVNMLDEIRDSIDDGLENTKMLVIKKVLEDSSLLYKDNFLESNYRIRELRPEENRLAPDMYSDTTLYTQNEKDFEPFRMLTSVFKPGNGKYYKLRVISSTVEEDDLIEDLFYALFWLYVILIGSVLLINHVLLRRIWKPFYQSLKIVNGYKLSTEQIPNLPESKVEEFSLLKHTITSLLTDNRERFVQQKQFIENVAHELQTPLAITRAKLEAFLEDETLDENQIVKLSSVVDSLNRQAKLNTDLLLLSKIENKQFIDSEEVCFNKLVRLVLADFEEWIAFKEIEVRIEEKARFLVCMNRSLAQIILNNLLKNAITHSEHNSEIQIQIGANSISISNRGIEELPKETIFNRFNKVGNVSNSTGLGLAITKSITHLYGLTVRYSFSEGYHHFLIVK